MISVIDVLKRDHRKIEDLFEKIDQSEDFAKRLETFNEISSELNAHVVAEEEILYPRAARKDETKAEANRAYNEHDEIRRGISKVERIKSAGNEWSSAIKELKKTVEQHVNEEERTFFPKVEKVFSLSELEEMAHLVQRSKERLPKAG